MEAHVKYIFEKSSFQFQAKLDEALKLGTAVKIKIFPPVWSEIDKSMMHSGYVTYAK